MKTKRVRLHRTTTAQDMEYLLARNAAGKTEWAIGDACLGYKLFLGPTTITAIDGDTVTMANGEHCHISHLRTPEGQARLDAVNAKHRKAVRR